MNNRKSKLQMVGELIETTGKVLMLLVVLAILIFILVLIIK